MVSAGAAVAAARVPSSRSATGRCGDQSLRCDDGTCGACPCVVLSVQVHHDDLSTEQSHDHARRLPTGRAASPLRGQNELGASDPTAGAGRTTGKVPPPRPGPDSDGDGLPSTLEFELVRGADQEVAATRSRRAQPRAWLRAVVWLVGGGVHPRAGERTLTVARDLAGRMDYTLGTVLYDLEGTAARLGVSRATVKRHVSILRELGALVWVRHGSKRNLHLPGRKYAGTATIYAAVVPPVFDSAMGHRLSGRGYEARVVGVTKAGHARAVAAARATAASRPPTSQQAREPHSPGRYKKRGKVEVDGGLKDTSRKRASRSTTSTSLTKASNRGGTPRRSPRQVARDIDIAREVRPLVPWAQGERLRRLAFALRPLIDQGLDAQGIAAELGAWQYLGGPGVAWRPAKPAAYITARLRDRAEDIVGRAAAVAPQDNVAWRAYCEQRQAAAVMAQLESSAAAARGAAARTDDDRRQAQMQARFAPRMVVEHMEQFGEDDAIDLFGWRMTTWASGLASSRWVR